MKKRTKKLISFLTSMIMTASAAFAVVPLRALAADPAKHMEYLNRGLTAIKTDAGIYLSWRLKGTEPLSQRYDIYRDNVKISTVDATNYTDTGGFSYNVYNVVPEGEAPKSSENAEVWQQNYIDIPLDRPSGGVTKAGESYTYSVNDTSVGDVDGDGEYEYIVKWDPSNSKDNSQHGYTGNVLLDCYKIDGTRLWRIDLGINIRAGAHYTQFIVYDFDGDGKAEMALRTAPGSKDGTGEYVSKAGSNLTWDGYNDSSDLRQSGSKSGHIIKGPDWLTMFNGETGKAMRTIDYYPQRGTVSSWGDSYGGRSERYLAGVAYLNGTTPSLIMCRGYYAKAAMAAYNWDGENFTKLWGNTYTSKASNSLYGQGTHSLSIADVDNDGYDEVIFGSAVMDHNGTVLNSTGHGHGDALHVSDFDNDGEQEIMMVHEEKTYYKTYGAEVRKGKDASIIANVSASSDCGRGVMSNIDDAYAQTNSNALSLFWSAANSNIYDIRGNIIQKTRTYTADGTTKTETVNAARPAEYNFLIYWDGDLGRELLDNNRIVKYTVGTDDVDARSDRLETFSGIHANNSSKSTPAISADLFGDWREEVAYGTDDNKALRIYTTVTPTDYKLTTLMHDSQYRCAVAWQNVGYNQPPHPSYYIGTRSLESGKNYLSPAAGFDTVEYANVPDIAEEVPDVEENMIYSVNSFDNGRGDFTSGTVTTLSAPYNNALSVTSSGSVDFGFTASTPDPNATPTPVPTASPTPAPEPKPIPAETAEPLYANDFNSMEESVLMNLGMAEPNTYTGIEGITLVTGNRSSDGTSTNWSISSGGLSGNMLVMNSGKYCNTRGPRIGFTTPDIPDGGSAELSIAIKLYSTGDNAAVLRYNDDITSVTSGTDISSYFSTSSYKIFKTVITNSGGKYTRTLYSDDTVIASDSKSAFPVLLGILANGTDYTYTGAYFDNFSITVNEPKEESLTAEGFVLNSGAGNAVVYNRTSEAVTAEMITAAYNSDSTLSGIEITDVELPAGNYVSFGTTAVAVPENGFARAFLWNKDIMEPISDAVEENSTVSLSSAYDNTATVLTEDGTALSADGTYKISFDWRPGTSVSIQNSEGQSFVTLSKSGASAIKYSTGTNDEKTVSASFTDSSHWYHAEITLDFTAKAADIAVMDYTANSSVKNVYSASFNGIDGFISRLVVSGASYFDNLIVNELKYNVDMSLVNVNVEDVNGSALENVLVTIGSKKLVTDSDGHCAIKLKSGTYSYSVTKAAYKSASGQVALADKADESIKAVLRDGEVRNIYVSYIFNQDLEIHESVSAGTAKENTTYTVPDSAKQDVTYTFLTDEEEIIPGYEDYVGQTYTFEYDPDNSNTVDVVVEEDYDTYVKLAYKIKRVPTDSDTEVARIHMSEDGVGRSMWNSNSYDFVQDEETGIKYTQFNNVASNPVTISFSNTSAGLVMEYDIVYKDIAWGGDYIGFIPYSGSVAGQGFGLRSSSVTNNQWQWAYRLGGDNYPARTDETSNKAYTASEVWRNKWAHVIVVCTGSALRFTVVNKDSGMVYIQDQEIPLANSVGTSSRPINKLVFTRVYGSNGEAAIGMSNFKAYTIGAAEGSDLVESAVDVKPTDNLTLTSDRHISDYDGVDYNASELMGATYEIQDENGTVVTPSGFSVAGGVLTTSLESFDGVPQYYVIVSYNGVPTKKIRLNYLTYTHTYGTIKGFGSGTSPFSLTSASGYGISNVNETLCYSRTAGTALNANVFLTASIWSGDLYEDFVFSYDYMVEDAFYKGYLYLLDANGNQLVKGETHLDEPRIKFFAPLPSSSSTDTFNSSSGFAKGKWYTFVFRGKGMSTSGGTIVLDIYNQGDYDYREDTASAEPVKSITFTVPANSMKGMTLRLQTAQGSGSQATDNGDKQYFDNMAFYYYEYK